jgi:hypothetical protein
VLILSEGKEGKAAGGAESRGTSYFGRDTLTCRKKTDIMNIMRRFDNFEKCNAEREDNQL